MYATLGLASADGQHKSATEFPETPEEGSGVVEGTATTRVDGSVGGDSATAMVCGAGIAGLLAARVLSERLERVVIVEPDLSTGSAGRRPGVPQGNHIHLMLPGGRQVLDQLVPGFIDALTAAGGIRACVTASSKGFVEGRWMPRFSFELWIVLCSRPLLESVLRDEVLLPGQVELLAGWHASELRSDQPGWVIPFAPATVTSHIRGSSRAR